MQRQLSEDLSISLLVLTAIIIRGLGSTRVICQNTIAFFQALKVKVIVLVQNSRWR